jgi:hypothetical protein
MKKVLTLSALVLAIAPMSSSVAHAWGGRHHAYYSSTQPTSTQSVPTSNYQGYRQGYARAAQTTNVWPFYPNYGNNPVGAAYSQAAGMRPGQFFGTFGLRPADARARGAY